MQTTTVKTPKIKDVARSNLNEMNTSYIYQEENHAHKQVCKYNNNF